MQKKKKKLVAILYSIIMAEYYILVYGEVWIITLIKTLCKFVWHKSSKFTLCRNSYDEESNNTRRTCVLL